MFVMFPVNVIVGSPTPSPTEKVKPVVPLRIIVPLVAVSVTCTAEEPASASLMLIRLIPAWKNRAVSSFVVCAPGTVFTGASFTGVMLIRAVSEPDLIPPGRLRLRR